MKEMINLSSNIIDEKNTEKIIRYTLETLANSLAKSVGPYGSNTIIQDSLGNHTITKDGYTIFKSLVLDNDISRTILDIIKTISLKLVNEVGDASTSSILVAYKLYLSLSDYKNSDSSLAPKMLNDILGTTEEVLIEMIKVRAIKIDDSNFEVISKIAAISNNNNYKLGNLIYEIYSEIGKDSFITIESSKTKEDYYEITDGYELLNGYVDSRFVNEERDQTFVGENPLIFMSNSELNETDLNLLANLSGYALEQQRPLVIIAKGMTEEVYNFLAINKVRNKDNYMVCPILVTLGTENREESLKDLQAYLDCNVLYNKLEIEPEDFEMQYLKNYETVKLALGTCGKVISDSKRTKFIESPKTETSKKFIQTRLDSIKLKIDKLKEKSEREENDLKLFELEKRYNKLNGSIATFYVGGNTEIEKKNKRYLVDDAIHAVRSAIESGYVIGGNLTIPKILNEHSLKVSREVFDKISSNNMIELHEIQAIVNCISNAFQYSYRCVLQNYRKFNGKNYTSIDRIMDSCLNSEEDTIYNLVKGKYETIKETDVINSADTDIQILHSVFSIIGLLVTSNQFLSITTYGEKAFDNLD